MGAENERGTANDPVKKENKSGYSIISLVLSLVPMALLLALFFLLVFASSNDIFAGTWPLFIYLVMPLLVAAFISSVLSVVFGIMGLVKSNRKALLSWAGIIVVSLEVLIYLLL